MHSAQEPNITEEKNAISKKDLYSIHTFEIKIPLNTDIQSKYLLFLKNHCDYNERRTAYRNQPYYDCVRQHHPDNKYVNYFTCYNNDKLHRMGISDICFVQTRILCAGYFVSNAATSITFQVNPRILLGYLDNRYICIVPSNELENIMSALVRIFLVYGFEESDFKNATIKRLDICANINLGDQSSAERYLKLLRKGGFYRGFRLKYMPVDPKSHRRMHPPNEARFINLSSTAYTLETLSIYLKHAQMLESSLPYNTAEIERAKGQIRFELRISNRKNIYLRKKYGCAILTDLISAAGVIGADILSKDLEGLYGKGKFIKYSRAIELIEHADNHHRATKDTMIQIVNQTRKTDLADAFQLLPPERISWFRKYFNELGISPITLRDSWKEDSFENPTAYIMTQNVNDR